MGALEHTSKLQKELNTPYTAMKKKPTTSTAKTETSEIDHQFDRTFTEKLERQNKEIEHLSSCLDQLIAENSALKTEGSRVRSENELKDEEIAQLKQQCH